jgi:hypothetical protein
MFQVQEDDLNRTIVSVGVCALAAIGSIGCGAADEDDTDKNKSFYIDGYTEPTTPAPASEVTSCAYSIAQAGGPAGVACGTIGLGGCSDNNVLPINLSWQGYRPGAPEPSQVNVAEFYDCDGSRGIHALYFDTSQYG